MRLVVLILFIQIFLTLAVNAQKFSLHENGVTVLCGDAEVGESGEVNGKTYIAVNRNQLDSLMQFGPNMPNVCTSSILDLSYIFSDQFRFSRSENLPNITHWDVSNVTSMQGAFYRIADFNQDISYWDVSKVTNMSIMFAGTFFNQDISKWDVSNVTDMSGMFGGDLDGEQLEYSVYPVFNQDISNWNVSKVKNMRYMFYLCTEFDQPIGQWDVSSVTDMAGMFHGATKFDQELGEWDVSNVTDMHHMFGAVSVPFGFLYANSVFNQDISNWNVSKVTDMQNMFGGNHVFNQDISNWDVRKVTNMRSMFANAQSFDQNITGWKVSRVEDMDFMFFEAHAFNQDLSPWCVKNIQAPPRSFSSLPNEYLPVWGSCPVGSSISDINTVPTAFTLEQNYPNPFNPTTQIQFSLPQASEVTLNIHNSQGIQIKTLADTRLASGTHTFIFDASNLPSGVYFYTLTSNNALLSRKMLLIK